MTKVTIKNKDFLLKGEIIKKGEILTFKSIDIKSQEVNSQDIPGIKIISFFPDINTRICDLQTKKIYDYAQKFPNINFISITMDQPNVIEKWCLSKDIKNIHIWSDYKFQDFANKTNLFIPEIKKLARGFLVLSSNNEILQISVNKEIASDPDYVFLDSFINKYN